MREPRSLSIDEEILPERKSLGLERWGADDG